MTLTARNDDELEYLVRTKYKVNEQLTEHTGWLINDYDILPYQKYYRTNNFLQRSLSYLFGYDDGNERWQRLHTDSNGNLNMSMDKATNILHSIVTTGAEAVLIAPARAERKTLLIKVVAGGTPLFIGSSTVTAADGMPLAAGEAISIDDCEAAVYGITGGAAGTVNILEGW